MTYTCVPTNGFQMNVTVQYYQAKYHANTRNVTFEGLYDDKFLGWHDYEQMVGALQDNLVMNYERLKYHPAVYNVGLLAEVMDEALEDKWFIHANELLEEHDYEQW